MAWGCVLRIISHREAQQTAPVAEFQSDCLVKLVSTVFLRYKVAFASVNAHVIFWYYVGILNNFSISVAHFCYVCKAVMFRQLKSSCNIHYLGWKSGEAKWLLLPVSQCYVHGPKHGSRPFSSTCQVKTVGLSLRRTGELIRTGTDFTLYPKLSIMLTNW